MRHLLSSAAATLLSALTAAVLSLQPATAATVRVDAVLGPIDIRLDPTAPATVANFLSYVRSGAYDQGFFHRSVPGFVIQGGGYNWSAAQGPVKTPAGPPVVNEFSPTRSNVRGTVAMAKLGGNPNSATTEWFVNLSDSNAANLDNQNGGFTVFGRLTVPGMATAAAVAALRIVDFSGCIANGGALSAVPVTSVPASCAATSPANLAMVTTARELPSPASEADRVFDWLEAAYPQYLKGRGTDSAFEPVLGYYYRYYAASNAYIGEKEGRLYYLVPAINNDINLLGNLGDFAAQAVQAGY